MVGQAKQQAQNNLKVIFIKTFKKSVLGKLSIQSTTSQTLLNREPTCHQLIIVRHYSVVFKFKLHAKEVLCTSEICCIDPSIPLGCEESGVKLVTITCGNCIPVYNRFRGVNNLSKTSFSYMN